MGWLALLTWGIKKKKNALLVAAKWTLTTGSQLSLAVDTFRAVVTLSYGLRTWTHPSAGAPELWSTCPLIPQQQESLW